MFVARSIKTFVWFFIGILTWFKIISVNVNLQLNYLQIKIKKEVSQWCDSNKNSKTETRTVPYSKFKIYNHFWQILTSKSVTKRSGPHHGEGEQCPLKSSLGLRPLKGMISDCNGQESKYYKKIRCIIAPKMYKYNRIVENPQSLLILV